MDFKRLVQSKGNYKRNTRYYVNSIIIILLYIIFSFVIKGFFSFNTLINILIQSAALSLASIGMTFIILTGGIDLSVGATVALSGCIAALVMQQLGSNGLGRGLLGVVVAILVAVTIGLINGIMIGFLKASPFIVTIAVMSISRGLTLTLSDASRVLVENSFFNSISSARIFNKLPIILLFVVLMYVCMIFILRKTLFGRKTYAIGDNPIASKAAGVNVSLQTCMVYVFSGIFIGLAAIIITGRASSAQPWAGVGMEFDVITAVVLGGTSLMGGRGNLGGTVLGVALISIISTGLGMLNVTPFVSDIVKGILIIFAMLSDRYATEKSMAVVKKETGHVDSKNYHKVLKLIEENKQQVLSLKNIYKTFPGVKALENVSFDIKRGKVHALVGENGAGKSTLMKILSGVYTKDMGEILIDGIPVSIKSPADSQVFGISVIYQEIPMVKDLNVYQNVYLGNEIIRKSKILLDSKKMIKNTQQLLNRFNLKINVKNFINDFTVGQQQMISIAKAVGSHSWVVVMDEPSSAITEIEKKKLFDIIRDIKAQGIAVVYISHRMAEIFEIADEITILRDGHHVLTAPIEDLDENQTIKHMVGRDLKDIFYHEKTKLGKVVLEVKNLFRKGVFEPISFKIHEGEILGFMGLMGSGRTEIMRCVFGLDKPDGGEIYLDGKKINIKVPTDAIKAGIAFISEDRKQEGIIPHMSLVNNISLPSLPWINKFGWIDAKKEINLASNYKDSLSIKTPSILQPVIYLSGGNQQKVCLGKWLALNPKIIIMDEPTRGIDVGAKSEIHKIIDKLREKNIAIILISSEMPEILGASDRVITIHEGKKTGEFVVNDQLTQEIIMKSASGLTVAV